MKAKKTIALILVMVMVLGLLTVTASADTAGSLGSPTNGIKSITISGANINNNEDRTLTGSSAPYNLTYNVKLASGTADGTVVTATFEKENPCGFFREAELDPERGIPQAYQEARQPDLQRDSAERHGDHDGLCLSQSGR